MTRSVVVLGLLLFTGCLQRNEVIEPDRGPAGRFTGEILPILNRSCNGASCHGGGARGFAGGLDLTSYAGIFRGSRFGTVVVPGSAYMSHLVQTLNWIDTALSPISSVRMPAGRDPIPPHDIRTVARWIVEGARNDDGSAPFAGPRPPGQLYFTSQAVDLVGVIDVATGLIARYVTVGYELPLTTPPQSPHNVQIDDQGRFYYVTLIRGNTLKKYDASTHELLGEVAVGTSPAHVVVTPDGNKAYVTTFDQSAGRVYAVNTSSMTVSKVISVAGFMKGTHGARLSHDGRYLYVGSNGTDLLHVIQTSNDSVLVHVPVAGDVPPFGSFVYKPYQVAVRGDDRYVYVTLNGRGLVSVIERNGDTFALRDTIPVGSRPLQCEVTRDQRYLYVANQGSGSVTVVDAQLNRVSTTIASVGKQPHGVDISDDSRTVFITCENVVSGDPPHHPLVGSKDPAFVVFIDVTSQSVIRRIEVGGFAAGVSVYPGRGN